MMSMMTTTPLLIDGSNSIDDENEHDDYDDNAVTDDMLTILKY